MSGVALAFIVFGLLVIVSRAPLMWAPEKTRNFILGLFNTDAKMRLLGVIFAVVGAAFAWAGWEVAGTPAAIVKYFGLVITLASIIIVVLPAKMRGIATRVWTAFSLGALRIIGALSTVFGLLLVFYGLNL